MLILLDVDAVIYLICLLYVVDVEFVVVVVLFLPDDVLDVLDELQVEEDVEEDVLCPARCLDLWSKLLKMNV